MYKLDFEKSEEPEMKLPTFIGSQKKLENSRKTKSLWLCGLQQTGKFLEDRTTRSIYLPPEKPVCRSGSNS